MGFFLIFDHSCEDREKIMVATVIDRDRDRDQVYLLYEQWTKLMTEP